MNFSCDFLIVYFIKFLKPGKKQKRATNCLRNSLIFKWAQLGLNQ